MFVEETGRDVGAGQDRDTKARNFRHMDDSKFEDVVSRQTSRRFAKTQFKGLPKGKFGSRQLLVKVEDHKGQEKLHLQIGSNAWATSRWEVEEIYYLRDMPGRISRQVSREGRGRVRLSSFFEHSFNLCIIEPSHLPQTKCVSRTYLSPPALSG